MASFVWSLPSTLSTLTPSPAPQSVRAPSVPATPSARGNGEIADDRISNWSLSPAPNRRLQRRIQPSPAPSVASAHSEASNARRARRGERREGGNPNFRWSARNMLLTYSQIGDRPNQALSDAIARLSPQPAEWAAVREHHQDGGSHWHVIVKFDVPIRSRNPAFFDVDGIHPNVKMLASAKSVRDAWTYLQKEEGADHFGPWQGPEAVLDAEGGMGKAKKDEKWGHIIASSSRDEYEERVQTFGPYDWVVNHDKIINYADKHWPVEPEQYVSEFTEFPHLTEEMRDWVTNEMPKRDRPKSLVVWGPTRTGKTEWARSLGRHTYMNGLFNADDIDEASDYIVLDDISLEHFPNYKSWFGAQKQFVVTDKYKSKRTVKWGKPCIWLSNENPLDIRARGINTEWIAGNTIVVNLDHRLYDVPDEPAPQPVRVEWQGNGVERIAQPVPQRPIPEREDVVYLEDLYGSNPVWR
ncbi:hypothetical protein SERLADRAFT_441268 [Serpula lacrymans var. lacrymans S7.9]|uniref:CRESS-DNA virus Rep endonuclease domain-containing protein n=1 Tax=Serpula lacrymans var. lacrymans (strain S7.9) TaxID=578457 RepID=F8P612_SERL9|nr:uncharacterized protein SERLADRAFT_441268 [Serpula lacrymans var. lacrymans S7.9]EGO20879.1 hypothetical protein SERLADRAFT_441268 [Serpula lacrymans var. lacrymans S7.9]